MGTRILEIERSLGDPWDATNAASLVSLAESFTADGAADDGAAGSVRSRIAVLADLDLVPVTAGGRLRRLDRLGRVSRHVLGRDADLALCSGLGALPASPLTSSVCASALIGLGDTALRLGVRATGPDDVVPPAWLADCFADLLIADAVATVACRSVHLLPDHCEVLAAAARWQTAQLIGEIVYAVALHDPAAASATTGPLAKLVHDFTTMTRKLQRGEPAHLVIGRRLPHLATAPAGDCAPDEYERLYDLAGTLPDLEVPAHDPNHSEASPGASERDAGWLHPAETDDLALRAAGRHRSVLHEQHRVLAAAARAGRAGPGLPTEGDRLVDPAREYALLLAAAASIRVWSAARDGTGPDSARPTDETWLLVALDRLLHRLGLSRPSVPAGVRTRLADVAMQRIREPRSLDLYADRMSG